MTRVRNMRPKRYDARCPSVFLSFSQDTLTLARKAMQASVMNVAEDDWNEVRKECAMTQVSQFETICADGERLKLVYGCSEASNAAFALLFVGDALPRFVHWGRPLAYPKSLLNAYQALRPQRVSGALDETAWVSVLPLQSEAWTGSTKFRVARAGRELYCRFHVSQVRVGTHLRFGGIEVPAVDVFAKDDDQGVALTWTCEIDDGGLVRQRMHVHNIGEGVLTVGRVELGYPVPADACEMMTTTGHHLRERSPQRQPLTIGRFQKESLVGRPDFDASLLLTLGTPGFGFERGEVYCTHVGWSGNSVLYGERTPYTQAMIGGGECLFDGEVVLDPVVESVVDSTPSDDRMTLTAETTCYTTPWVYGSYGSGLDEASARFHQYVRSCHPNFARKPRPVNLNTWEAVYFNQNFETLAELADKAAQVGVERFVVDDGWFGARRDDTKALGDWVVSRQVWPEGKRGLAALADHVHARGMQFGLWFEPEMISPDSDAARKHPEWVLHADQHRLPMQGRSQQVMDLTNPEAYRHVFGAMDSLVERLGIDYIKWDHNKWVTEAVSLNSGLPAVHRQTLAVYRMFSDLKARHPELEIESCASGGARVDLGILEFADRIWVSDCVDPVERTDIQRYTSLLVPPEMLGEHVGDSPAHSTARATSEHMRMATALFGSMGVEWNLLKQNDESLEELGRWIAVFKDRREDFRTGRVVHGDDCDPAVRLDGVVSVGQRRATYRFTQLTTSQTYPAAPVRLPGLDRKALYRVRPLCVSEDLQAEDIGNAQSPCLWWNQEGVELDGEALGSYGLRLPSINPAQAVVFEAVKVE